MLFKKFGVLSVSNQTIIHVPVLLLHRSQLDSTQWDDFIAASPQQILYAYSWYLDTVSPDWKALVLTQNGQWQAVMPLPCRQKWGLKVIQQPFFCQLLGIFAHLNVDFQEASNLLLSHLTTSFRYVSIYTGRFAAQTVFPNSLKIKKANNVVLPLHLPYAVLFQNYSNDRKTNLKRAQLFGWQSKQSTDIEPIIQLFQKNHSSQIAGGVSEKAYDLLRKITAVLAQKKALRLVYATKDGRIEAGALFAIFENRIIYLFNAASPTGRKGNGRTWLIDKIIQEYAGTDFVFDFESPELPSIASFYQSFGGVEEIYTQFTFNDLPFPLKQIQNWRIEKSARQQTTDNKSVKHTKKG
ncbi:GNAT family N-acetyltransferase [Runella aurantiaca]|nr:GNAT family N-acetyltransferase [Runella aurantiaca]